MRSVTPDLKRYTAAPIFAGVSKWGTGQGFVAICGARTRGRAAAPEVAASRGVDARLRSRKQAARRTEVRAGSGGAGGNGQQFRDALIRETVVDSADEPRSSGLRHLGELLFMLREHRPRELCEQSVEMVCCTSREMRSAGIARSHRRRLSTDIGGWRLAGLPHFEKMLSTQAQLAIIALSSAQVAGGRV